MIHHQVPSRYQCFEAVDRDDPAAKFRDVRASELGERAEMLRRFFGRFCDDRKVQAAYWESVARLVVGAFRADAVRAGAAAEVQPLVDELSRLSPEFKAMWRDNDVRSHGEGVKQIRHPALGPIAFEYSAFAVDGRPDLSMAVYNPATPTDPDKIN